MIFSMVVLGLLVAPPTPPVFLRARVASTRIIDGDTIELGSPTKTKVRIRYLDCPESKQPGGAAATAQAKTLISRQNELSINIVSTDLYHRLLGDVFIGSYSTLAEATNNATNLGRALVDAGYCLPYRNRGPYKPAMRAAMEAHRGPLWNETYSNYCEPDTQSRMKSGAIRCIPRLDSSYMKGNCSIPRNAAISPLPIWCMDPRTPPWVWRKSLTEIRNVNQ